MMGGRWRRRWERFWGGGGGGRGVGGIRLSCVRGRGGGGKVLGRWEGNRGEWDRARKRGVVR